MKSALEQTKDEIIVGSYSVSMPVKAFDIICNDFRKLEKQNDKAHAEMNKLKVESEKLVEALIEISDKTKSYAEFTRAALGLIADEALQLWEARKEEG